MIHGKKKKRFPKQRHFLIKKKYPSKGLASQCYRWHLWRWFTCFSCLVNIGANCPMMALWLVQMDFLLLQSLNKLLIVVSSLLLPVYLVASDMRVSYMLVVTLQFEVIACGNEKVRLWMPPYDWLILRRRWCGGGGEHFLTWTSSIVLRVFNFKVRTRFASFSHTPKHSGCSWCPLDGRALSSWKGRSYQDGNVSL